MFALTPQGKLRWTLSVPGEPLTPAVDEARRQLVVADMSGGVSGFQLSPGDRRPVRLWSHSLSSISYGNPALATDGTTYETAGDSLYAIAANGPVLWQVKTPAQVEVSAAVGDDGTVVFGSDNRLEYGIRPDGTIAWRHAIGNYTYSSPLALAGHRVIFGDHSSNMTILNQEPARGPGESYYRTTGVWTDRLRRSGDGWVFTSRAYRYLWLDLSPFPGEVFPDTARD